jgi:hypothetical protein
MTVNAPPSCFREVSAEVDSFGNFCFNRAAVETLENSENRYFNF